MAKLIVPVLTGMLLFLLACGGGTDAVEPKEAAAARSVTIQSKSLEMDEANMVASAPIAPSFAASEAAGGRAAPGLALLQTVQRKVISSATVSIEVKVVEEAVPQIRTIAEGMGGFVEQLSSSGVAERQQASMTIRVPQDQFFTVLERIEALGEVQSKHLGSEDVSEQFIDLEARLKSSLREEESLLALLGKAAAVSEVLTIERELARVRSEIERFQGQLNFLERRVALATIRVSLFPPPVPVDQPPSGRLSLEVEDVSVSLEAAKGMVVSLDGVVDQAFVSERNGKESADVTLRVRAADFNRVMGFLEARGTVKTKEVREGTGQVELGGDADQSIEGDGIDEEPEARIELSLLEEDDSLSLALVIGVIVAISAVVLLALLVINVYGSPRRVRRNI